MSSDVRKCPQTLVSRCIGGCQSYTYAKVWLVMQAFLLWCPRCCQLWPRLPSASGIPTKWHPPELNGAFRLNPWSFRRGVIYIT